MMMRTAQQVVDLVDGDALPLQLLIDAVEALDAASTRAWMPASFSLLADDASPSSARNCSPSCGALRRRPAPACRRWDRRKGRPGLPVRRESCPCPGDARWERRFPASRGRSAAGGRAGGARRVRMLCRRSASLMRTTRMSSTMASIILRRFSAWRSSRVANSILLILVTPSTMCATCSPNSRLISSMVTEVSSTASCSRPAAMATGSSFISASTEATSRGCTR